MTVQGKWWKHESSGAVSFAIGPMSLMTLGSQEIWIDEMQEDFYKKWEELPWTSGECQAHIQNFFRKVFTVKIIK